MRELAAGLLVGLVLVGCSTGAGEPLPVGVPTVSTAPIAFYPGDCVRVRPGGSLEKVDCATAHQGQVVLSRERFFSGDAMPPDAQMARLAEAACAEARPEAGSVRMSSSRPTGQTWAGGDRHLTCIAVLVDGDGEPVDVVGPLPSARS